MKSSRIGLKTSTQKYIIFYSVLPIKKTKVGL